MPILAAIWLQKAEATDRDRQGKKRIEVEQVSWLFEAKEQLSDDGDINTTIFNSIMEHSSEEQEQV